MDFTGVPRDEGGDLVDVKISADNGEVIDNIVTDNDDGTYSIEFTPRCKGPHSLEIKIFQRHIKDSPVQLEVVDSNPPLASFGSRGVGEFGLVQPCSLVLAASEELYVVDTGNSRLVVLSSNLQFRRHVLNAGLEGRSVTGICLGPSGETLLTVNWRSRTVTEMTLEGVTVSSLTHPDMMEPIAVAVGRHGDVYVADNGAAAVLVFSPSGKLKQKITVRNENLCNKIRNKLFKLFQ